MDVRAPSKPFVALSLALGVATVGLTAGWALWPTERIAGPVRVVAQPRELWIEAGDAGQSLNFDFVLENLGPTPVGLDRVELQVFDREGRPVLRRFVDSNGSSPSIQTIPRRVLGPGERLLVFNPFHDFRADIDLHRLSFEFGLSIPDEAPDTIAMIEVQPRVYEPKTVLSLPAQGKLLVHDGHDFYAHHRRLDTEHPLGRELGLTQNFMRFALDLVPTDEAFSPYRGDGATNEDWYAWGAPVLAAGDGVVVSVHSADLDNHLGGPDFFSPEVVKTEPMRFFGNHVVLDHGNGEFSLFGHLQQGSVTVALGQRVVRGQALGRMGSSGSSGNPHLHYELRDGPDLGAEGLPAIFTGYSRHLGARRLEVAAAPVDSGDLLEAL